MVSLTLKKSSKKSIIKKIIIGGILIFLLTNTGFRNLIKRKIEQNKLQKNISQIKNNKLKLEKEIELLQENTYYIEYVIRRELGYLKPEEFEYRPP